MANETRKTKEVLGERCGGLDGASVWRMGRTAEDRLLNRIPIKTATSGNGERNRAQDTFSIIHDTLVSACYAN